MPRNLIPDVASAQFNAGAVWNSIRSNATLAIGAPDSTVRLPQRKLVPPYDWGMATENSGLSLQILDRIASERSSSLTLSADNVDERYFCLGRGILRPMVAPVGRPFVSIDQRSFGDVDVPQSLQQRPWAIGLSHGCLTRPLIRVDPSSPRTMVRFRVQLVPA